MSEKPLPYERRWLTPEKAELRATVENEKRVLVGYAARFNELSLPLDDGDGEYQERILPGAFTKTLSAGHNIFALAHHDEKQPLGSTFTRQLKLVEDEYGLRALIHPSNTSYANDILTLVDDEVLTTMSFGFNVDDEEYRNEDSKVIREIRSATLFEVSVVTWAAYPSTSIKVRADVAARVRAARKSAVPLKYMRMKQIQAEKYLLL